MGVPVLWKVAPVGRISILRCPPITAGIPIIKIRRSHDSFIFMIALTLQRKTVFILTHWGRVTHICVGYLTIIGSDNGLSPDRRQAITWTNAGILLFRPFETNFSEILIKIRNIFIQGNALENFVCETAGILSRPQCVKMDPGCSLSQAPTWCGPWLTLCQMLWSASSSSAQQSSPSLFVSLCSTNSCNQSYLVAWLSRCKNTSRTKACTVGTPSCLCHVQLWLFLYKICAFSRVY